MNVRTLNKENSIHVLVLSSMLMAWGVTSNYFETYLPNNIIHDLGNFLMLPIKITDFICGFFHLSSIVGNPMQMFLVLWIAYLIPCLKFYPLLKVKNHQESDLKKWYAAKCEISK